MKAIFTRSSERVLPCSNIVFTDFLGSIFGYTKIKIAQNPAVFAVSGSRTRQSALLLFCSLSLIHILLHRTIVQSRALIHDHRAVAVMLGRPLNFMQTQSMCHSLRALGNEAPRSCGL